MFSIVQPFLYYSINYVRFKCLHGKMCSTHRFQGLFGSGERGMRTTCRQRKPAILSSYIKRGLSRYTFGSYEDSATLDAKRNSTIRAKSLASGCPREISEIQNFHFPVDCSGRILSAESTEWRSQPQASRSKIIADSWTHPRRRR